MNEWQNMMNQLVGNNNNNNLRPYGFAQHYEITQVSGRAGAENFRMGPNSSFLLLDNTAPIIWFVKTDGSGLLTATPCDYSIHQDPPPINLNDIMDRLQSLEEKLNDVQSNSGYVKQRKSKPTENSTQTSNTTV